MYDSVVDIERARQQRQASMRSLGASLLIFGSIVLAAGGLLAFVVPVRERVFGGQSDPGDVFLAVAIFAGLACGLSAWAYYQAKPIPNEPLHAPVPFELTTDQAWRCLTNPQLRFLERLKMAVVEQEKNIQDAHGTATTAYNSIPQALSYPEYRSTKALLGTAETRKQRLLKELPPLYERIEKIAAGDVGGEILAIREEIKKLEREKQESQRKLIELEKPCTVQHKYDYEVEECKRRRERQRERLHGSNHDIDCRVIELQTDLEELQNYDFRLLWRETGLQFPAAESITRASTDSLKSLKEKVETLNSIPDLQNRQRPLKPAPGPSLEQQIADAEARLLQIDQESEQKQQRETAAGRPLQAQKFKHFYDDLRRGGEEELKALKTKQFRGGR